MTALHVGGGRTLAGLDEVGVLLGDERATDPEPTKAEPVDQLARRQLAGDRVDEHRAGVLPAGLVLAPPVHDLGDLALGLVDIAG